MATDRSHITANVVLKIADQETLLEKNCWLKILKTAVLRKFVRHNC
jgi:hypothetical protein